MSNGSLSPRHGWVIAITSEPEAIVRRVSADRTITCRPLTDGRTIVVAATPDVAVREHDGALKVDPIRDVTIAAVDTTTGRTRAYRTILCIPEVYWASSSAHFLLGGSLAELLPLIGSPRIAERSLVDHHLFRWVPGARTPLEGVFHLLPGHELQWSGQGKATVTQRQSLRDLASEERQPVGVASAMLQVDALQRAVTPELKHTRPEERAVLLSGGIDSSVIQMALDAVEGASPGQSRSYLMADTPDWVGEDDYCREAVRILGTQHEFTTIRPVEYPDLLIDTLAMLGRPFGHEAQPVILGLFRALAAGGPTTLWTGQAADNIYGSEIGETMCRRLRYARVPRLVLRALGLALQPFWPTKAQAARQTARFLDALRDETSPDHPANTQSRYADVDAVTAWFGERMVKEAMTERRDLAALLAAPVCELERVHMVALFSAGLYTASMDFQLGAAAGCTVLQPYLDEEVARTALRVDPAQRYYHGGRTKPLLKLALQERTGLDFVSRPKRGGGFYADLCAWMREGVLADMVRSIERPGYADRRSFDQKIEAPDRTTWNLLLMDLYVKHLRSLR